MTTNVAATIEAGRQAWQRLKGERKTWSDWLAVARCLEAGRAQVMKDSKTNRPVGTTYNTAMGTWLREQGLDGVTAQERYRLGKILANLADIGPWLASLDDAQRRKWNHPSAIWGRFRIHKTAVRAAATADKLATMPTRKAGPVYWSQDHVSRAHSAMLRSRSSDLLVLARLALEGAVRTADDLLVLIPQREPLSPRTAGIFGTGAALQVGV
jgi:hypothetical protein